jgi:hypothetical protein
MRWWIVSLVVLAALLGGCSTKRGIPKPLRRFQFLYGHFL